MTAADTTAPAEYDFQTEDGHGGYDRDYVHHLRQETLRLRLAEVGTKVRNGIRLCGECLEFHGKGITCDEVAEFQAADAYLMACAIG